MRKPKQKGSTVIQLHVNNSDTTHFKLLISHN